MPRAKSADAVERVGPRLVAKSVRVKPAPAAVVPHERIAIRAYELFLQEGGGSDVSHWLRAEQELLETQAPVRVKKAAGTQAKV
jgi:hypothetical protein